jgi:hypothetical protein
MKRILLLIAVMALVTTVSAQSGFSQLKNPRWLQSAETSLKPIVLEEYVEPMEFTPVTNMVQIPTVKSGRNIEETHIMTTQYDLQTNTSLGSRVHAWPDGTVAATATWSAADIPATRGTGYNYYDGAAWGPMPTERVEGDVFSGWPSIIPYGENGEAIFSHGGTPFGINMYVREIKGEGEWVTLHNLENPDGFEMTWPRAIASGENNQYIHLIAADQDDALDSYLLFNRSTDGGATWSGWTDVPEVNIEDYYFRISADDYTAASNGNTVAFLFADAFFDLFYIKSDDNGETWEKHIIFDNPLSETQADFENAFFDTTYTIDNSGTIAIDNDGNVHAAWGIMRYLKDEVGTTFSYFPFVSGIGYWNETVGELPEHPNGELYTLEPEHLFENGLLVGWTPDLDGDGTVTFEEYPEAPDVVDYRTSGMATMPSISIDDIGSIAVFFSTVNETRWNDIFYYRSIFASYKDGIYGTWYLVEDDLMEGFIHLFDEGIYPTAATKAYNNTFHLTYQADVTQGLALDEDHPYQDNQIYAVKIGGYWVGLEDFTNPVNRISSAYPNPASGSHVNFDLSLSKASNNVVVSVYNLAGQLVSQDKKDAFVGINKISVETESLSNGVYFCTITVDNYKETRKFVVR